MPREVALKRILVGVDGSPESMEACRHAVELARGVGATVIALHVAVPHVPRSSFDITPETARHDEDAARAYGASVLEEAREMAAGVVSLATELVFGDPAEVILQRARELSVDLVVVGSRGLGAVDRLLLGSVSTAVSQRATCAVLVVRERESDAT